MHHVGSDDHEPARLTFQILVLPDLINNMIDHATFSLGDNPVRVEDPQAQITVSIVLRGDNNLWKDAEYPISGFPRCIATEDPERSTA